MGNSSETNKPWLILGQATVEAVWAEVGARLEGFGVSFQDLLDTSVERTLRRFHSVGHVPTEDSFQQAMGMVALEDLGLAIAWERGDQRAWDAYATDYRDAVVGAALRQGFHAAAAEELGDEIPGSLLIAGANNGASPLARYNGSGSLKGWLCTIARRRVADGIRALAKSKDLEQVSAESEQPGPQANAEQAEVNEQLRSVARVLRQELSVRERLVFLFKHEQDLSQREIATRLGISDSRVTRLLQHATAKVRELLVRQFGAASPEELLLSNELLRTLGGRADHPGDDSPSGSPRNENEQ